MKSDQKKHSSKLPLYLVIVYFIASIPITIYLAQQATRPNQYAQTNPTSNSPTPTPPYVTPTFNCLANTCPTSNPDSSPTPTPTPSRTSQISADDPCSLDPASIQNYNAQTYGPHHRHGHNDRRQGLIHSLIDFFINLINLFLKLLGLPPIDIGNLPAPGDRNPAPAPAPGDRNPDPAIPCPTNTPTPTTTPPLTQPVTTNTPTPPLSISNPAPSTNTSICTPNITVDASKDPELKDWLENTVVPDLKKWYPEFVQKLALPDYTPICNVTIDIDPSGIGVAATSGKTITISSAYFNKYRDDVGALQHEMIHIIQAYRSESIPPWIVEGIADWARGYMYKDSDYPKPDPGSSYTKGYRIAAYFLNWIQTKYDANLIHKLNVAGHNNTYTDAFWTQNTGKTIDELWDEMMATN